MVKKNAALLYFHQGWTDIINCLALINYYKKNYKKIYLLARNDAKSMIDYYIRNNNSIIPIYILKEQLDKCNFTNNIIFLNVNILHSLPYDILFHGIYDILRKDNYQSKFNINKKLNLNFVELFYTCYDLDYDIRFKYFDLDRNLDLENNVYNNFIKVNGDKYILYHHIHDECKNTENIKLVNLDNKTQIFFDYIKILENSCELHLLDSVWAAIVYLLNKKYGMFTDKKVYIYCKRGYHMMFNNVPDNFILIN